eukprot:1143419-Pelagomonas_calceolata.AAC.1
MAVPAHPLHCSLNYQNAHHHHHRHISRKGQKERTCRLITAFQEVKKSFCRITRIGSSLCGSTSIDMFLLLTLIVLIIQIFQCLKKCQTSKSLQEANQHAMTGFTSSAGTNNL